MRKLCFPGSALLISIKRAIKCIAISCLALCACAHGQHTYTPDGVRVGGLPTLMARSHDASDVLLTSLDTILHDREVCCGKDSARSFSNGRNLNQPMYRLFVKAASPRRRN